MSWRKKLTNHFKLMYELGCQGNSYVGIELWTCVGTRTISRFGENNETMSSRASRNKMVVYSCPRLCRLYSCSLICKIIYLFCYPDIARCLRVDRLSGDTSEDENID